MAYPPHDHLLVAVVALMCQHGFTDIRADHLPGFTRPGQIGQHRPDVTGVYQGRLCIVAAKSGDDFALSGTQARLTAFLSVAKLCRGILVLAAPQADRAAAENFRCKIGGSDRNTTIWSF